MCLPLLLVFGHSLFLFSFVGIFPQPELPIPGDNCHYSRSSVEQYVVSGYRQEFIITTWPGCMCEVK